ncbi:MAG: hypothetical protein O9345_21875 [Burkholderiaceae bacterium]|jgi:hypothetical protein|nr:hypothetical protein [Burkholderiales bacterium]MCZ8340768.1 hypothetical protein [Burkholderiaceae bacterium]
MVDRTSPHPLVALACLGILAITIPYAASPGGPSAQATHAAVRIEADCRVVEAVRLEPLGDEAEESVFAAHARCRAAAGPLPGATADVDLVWAFDRGRLERDAMRWRSADGALTTPSGTSVAHREPDGRWRADLRGTVSAAEGRAAALTGRPFLLVARLDTTMLAPVADPPGEDDR